MSVYLKDDKVLLRDGNVATSSDCCCCPEISVTCDSISASKSKCGFTEFGDPSPTPKFYLRKDSVLDGLRCDPGDWSPFPSPQCPNNVHTICTNPIDASTTKYQEYDNTVDPCSLGDSVITESHEHGYCCDGVDYNEPNANEGIWLTGEELGLVNDSGTSRHVELGNVSVGCHEIVTETLSSEYTTEMLISNTVDALPEYDDDFDDDCFASRDLSDDESSYTIQRFKPKFTIADSVDFDVIICYNEHFIPDDDSDPVDTPKTATISIGETEVEGDEVMEPDEDGEVTITDVTCGPCEE